MALLASAAMAEDADKTGEGKKKDAPKSKRTDVVVLKNGDRITGEVKELQLGMLKFKTDSIDTIYIQWEDIVYLTSKQTFQVESTVGEFYFGTISQGEAPGSVKVKLGESEIELDGDEVVRIVPIKKTFWGRVDGKLNLGITYTQASQVATFTFDGDASYRARKFKTGVTWNYVFTRQETGDTQQSDLFFDHTRFRKERWFNTAALGFQSNDEQGLDLRIILSGTYGRYSLQTNSRRLSWAGGLAANQEFQTGSDDSRLSLEGLLNLNFHAFRYKDPELDFQTSLTVYPSITEWGRVRADFTAVLAYEIFNDFTVSLNLVDNYDSEPPVEGAAKNTIRFTLSFGWSF